MCQGVNGSLVSRLGNECRVERNRLASGGWWDRMARVEARTDVVDAVARGEPDALGWH